MQSLMHSHLAIGVHRTEAPTPRRGTEPPPRTGPPPRRSQRAAARVLMRVALRLDAESARRVVA